MAERKEKEETTDSSCWSQKVKILDTICCAHHWNVVKPPSPEEEDENKESTTTTTTTTKGLVVIYHGFLAHGKYPTVKYAAEFATFCCTIYSQIKRSFPYST